MSAGRSSQLAACFSLDRTKYLIVSKWIPARPATQLGIGLRSKSFSAFRRVSRIHSGSDFLAEMSRTTSSLSPRRALAPAESESAQPYAYLPRESMVSSWVSGAVVRRGGGGGALFGSGSHTGFPPFGIRVDRPSTGSVFT